ncbi:hypothetical protein B9479_002351 [Cryptococcus floricola]|uniref:EXS domain-containing protein n=1 Tax=Cryptococcus floricola TaxID=2591691 RepID=A0A5D3B3T1_9TREE|nr:hypothetical protein B9479_002351 [Cryptococcus floricola]
MDIDSPPSESFPTPQDPHNHINLPSFSASFPLPFRVLFLVGVALLLWAINLQVLSWIGLDMSWILDLRDDPGEGVEGLDDGVVGELVEEGALELVNSPRLRAEPPRHAEDQPPDTPIRPTSSRLVRPPSKSLHVGMYKLFAVYTAFVGAAWGLFWVLSGGGDEEAMEGCRWVPGLTALGVVAAVSVPWRGVGERERLGFRRAMKRILLPKLNDPIYFSDVILADILTSFAKVLGDLWISAAQIWNGNITQGRVGQTGVGRWITLAMVSLPYLLRFRQCLFEFHQSSYSSPRPLANALKYFSAFPVIFLSAAQKTVVTDIANSKGLSVQELAAQHASQWFGEHRLFRLWLLAVCVNSMYSFWWDVTMDWGLALLEVDTWFPRSEGGLALGSPGGRGRRAGFVETVKRLFGRSRDINHQRSPCPSPAPFPGSNPTSPTRAPISASLRAPSPAHTPTPTPSRSLLTHGLRQHLLLPDPLVYHLFTIIDLILRFTWSLKLSSHLHTISEIESGVFLMETLELVRRWMWVFVRAEWEAVKMGEGNRWGRGKVVWEGEDE